MKPHLSKLFVFSLLIALAISACGGFSAPAVTPAPPPPPTTVPTPKPTATAHPTKLVGGCQPFTYDGRTYDLTKEDQIIDFRGRTRVIIVTCVVDAPMVVDSTAAELCPADGKIVFDSFGAGECSGIERFGNSQAWVYTKWASVDPIWPAGAPSAGPEEYPDELPEPQWLTPPPPGPQA